MVLVAAVLGVIGIGVGALDAGVAALAGPLPTPRPRLSSVNLPVRYSFLAISRTGSSLRISGLDVPSADTNPSPSARCVSAAVDRATLRLSGFEVSSCREGGSKSPFFVVESATYTNHAIARIAHLDKRTSRIILGPVVMTWSDASDTHLQVIVGDGSLWLFDAATTRGSEVVRVSERTGKVDNTIPIPGGLDRPILATDADGLWMGVATNGGYAPDLAGSPIYHIAVGSNVATIVFTGGHATFWMVASGHTLWDDVATISTPGGQLTQTIWRFDGPKARRVFHTRTVLPFGVSVVGDKAEGLWTVASQLPRGVGPNADTGTNCTRQPVVVAINPDTGRQRVVATLPPGSAGRGFDCQSQDLGVGQGVIAGGNLYLLDDVTGAGGGAYTKLLRIQL